MKKDLKTKWAKEATDNFKGMKVKEIRWMTDREVAEMMWVSAAPVIVFTNGVNLIASSDDEGNGPGTLFSNLEKMQTLPVI